jgi:hypothetical protein
MGAQAMAKRPKPIVVEDLPIIHLIPGVEILRADLPKGWNMCSVCKLTESSQGEQLFSEINRQLAEGRRQVDVVKFCRRRGLAISQPRISIHLTKHLLPLMHEHRRESAVKDVLKKLVRGADATDALEELAKAAMILARSALNARLQHRERPGDIFPGVATDQVLRIGLDAADLYAKCRARQQPRSEREEEMIEARALQLIRDELADEPDLLRQVREKLSNKK